VVVAHELRWAFAGIVRNTIPWTRRGSTQSFVRVTSTGPIHAAALNAEPPAQPQDEP
jgi:hypothetical protein